MNQDFTQGDIARPLFQFAFPVFLAMLLQVMYGAVDLMVVGKFGMTADVSGVSTGSQITQSVTYVIVGLAMGTTILLGQYLGEGKQESAGKIIGSSICFFGGLALLMTFAMPFLAEPLCRLMQAPEEAFTQTVSYVRICMLGSLFIVAFNLLGSILRGLGDSKTPLIAVSIACVCNIAGDIVLVKNLCMGAGGAAIATVAAQAVSVVFCFFILKKKGFPFPFSRADICFNTEIIKKIVKLGAPLALQDLLVNISFLVILAIVNSLGVVISAGVGVAEKLCGFVMLIPSSLSQSLSAFVAQNYGAKEYDRAKKSLFYAIGFSFVCATVISYLNFFHGNVLARLFTDDAAVVAAAFDYLKAYAIDVLLTSFMFCFNGYFSGCGRTGFVMFHGIFSAFCIRIPVSYYMSLQEPVSLFHIALATPCSTFVQCILCIGYFIIMQKQLKKESSISQSI